MKKRLADHKVTRSEEFTEGTFGIDKNNLAHIFDVLRNSLYSDAIMAIVREYSTNAVDAQREAGNDKRFHAVFPTSLKPTFSIRDYGIGLMPEEVMAIYCMYGTSTKRNSNEFNGMLGLGSKSAFSYVEAFTISSFRDGKKYIFNAYIDETLIGKIALMETLDTTEPDGVEIKVPVNTRDISRFNEVAHRVYSWFDEKDRPTTENYTGRKFDQPKAKYSGKDWYLMEPQNGGSYNSQTRDYSHQSFAVMGNVAYPINPAQVKSEVGKSLVNAGIIMFFKIGEVEFSANREALQYTEVTKKRLNERIDEIVSSLKKEAEDSIQNAPNIWAAYLALQKAETMKQLSPSLTKNILSSSQWKGKPLTHLNSGFMRLPGIEIREFYRQSANDRGIDYRQDIQDRIHITENTTIVVNDEGLRALGPRIGLMLRQQKDGKPVYNQVYVISFKGVGIEGENNYISSMEAEKNWYTTYDFATVPVVKMSDLPTLPKKPKAAKTSKHCAKVFEIKASTAYYGKSYSWEEVDLDLENAEGVYLDIYGWKIQDTGVKNWGWRAMDINSFMRQIDKMKAVGMTIPKFYGIKTGKITSSKAVLDANAKLQTFMEWLKPAMEKFVGGNEEFERAIVLSNNLNCSTELEHVSNVLVHMKSKDTPMHKLTKYQPDPKEKEKMKVTLALIRDLDDVCSTWLGYSVYDVLKTKREDGHPLDDKEKVYARYPLLTTLGLGYANTTTYSYQWQRNINGTELNKSIAEYIDLVERDLQREASVAP